MNTHINYSQKNRHLIVIEDEKYRQTISLEEETYSIGRHTKNSIVIHSQQASRRHGTLMKRKNRHNNTYSYWIIDGDLDGNKSRNGIYVNGEKCLIKELKNGDLINFGCEVNATYYASHEWSNTVIDIGKNKHQELSDNFTEVNSQCTLSQPHMNFEPESQPLNPKDTLQAQEYQDTLTQLPNRILFKEYLLNALKNANQYHTSMAVILLDINHFKAINKNWGYPVGDKILVEVAQRLKSSLRDSDIVARWGDDEFIILLPKISHGDNIEKITQRILKHISQPLELSETLLYLEYSVGSAIYPQDAPDSNSLLRKAEIGLLNHQKEMLSSSKKSHLTIDAKASKLLKAKTALQQALNDQELELYYQPQMKIKTGEISGVEALVRWNHPDLGQINPQKFIPVAEQTDSILLIGEWILREACRQNKAWQDMGLPNFIMSVNLSPLQLKDPNFVNIVKQILQETKLSPHWLELEITEKALLTNSELAHQVLQDLRQLGVHLSMDDFGTGYSCLNHLPKFPFGTLKIAQSCVQQLTEKPETIAIISAAVALGNSLDLRVIAEGVETHKQLDLLQNLDCKEAQGYLLSQPLNYMEATQFLDLYQEQKVPC
ncbi:EAL domain-containing protein [Crocosphaera sp.]|uniref:EAL domain-containing protein n=1 Tax=Crocosphaera sp. TaxID=2729996 RepID=UPI003F25378C|nr:EAL domain-containing protein [Crocosphaera sp.]